MKKLEFIEKKTMKSFAGSDKRSTFAPAIEKQMHS